MISKCEGMIISKQQVGHCKIINYARYRALHALSQAVCCGKMKIVGGRGGTLVLHQKMVAHLLFCLHPASCTHQRGISLRVWTQDVKVSDRN